MDDLLLGCCAAWYRCCPRWVRSTSTFPQGGGGKPYQPYMKKPSAPSNTQGENLALGNMGGTASSVQPGLDQEPELRDEQEEIVAEEHEVDLGLPTGSSGLNPFSLSLITISAALINGQRKGSSIV